MYALASDLGDCQGIERRQIALRTCIPQYREYRAILPPALQQPCNSVLGCVHGVIQSPNHDNHLGRNIRACREIKGLQEKVVMFVNDTQNARN
jgi:hypothetical protein